LSGVLPLRIARIHRATIDSLEVLVDEIEAENAMLNDTIKELEYALMPPSIFASLTATVKPWKIFDRTPESSLKLKGTSSFIAAVRQYVGENIKKIIYCWTWCWQ
jgi:hypothetical protein